MCVFPVFDQSRFRFLTYESCECYKNRSLLHRIAHNLQFILDTHTHFRNILR
ncbi:hypothetical protein Hanom_Chr11g00993091 [Helianthus anomalus]